MSATLLRVEDFEVRRTTYAASPWRVFHAPTDQQVSVPKTLTNGDGKEVSYRGPAGFSRKRDALAWLAAELPALVASHNGAA